MLLNKFQRDRERQQHREEEERREKDHWRCPFFVYCWEEGLHCHRYMIVLNAMVKAADHIRSHVMLMNSIDVSAVLSVIG